MRGTRAQPPADRRRDDLRGRPGAGRRAGPARRRRSAAGSRTCATLLLFIWVVNILGFIPLPLTGEKWHGVPTWGIYAATSSLSVTLALALLTFVFTHYRGHPLERAARATSRAGSPRRRSRCSSLIVPLEILGQFMRLISLCVRLFANMLAGHILILDVHRPDLHPRPACSSRCSRSPWRSPSTSSRS